MANRKTLSSVNGGLLGRGGRVEIVIQNDVLESDSYGTHAGQREQCVQVCEDSVSLLYIQATEQSCLALLRAAQRIRGGIRRDDTVLLAEKSCAILLPKTPLVGAQAVARRVYSFLIDVDYDLQILYGVAATTLFQQVQNTHEVVLQKDIQFSQETPATKRHESAYVREDDPLPYLAFLSNYPPQRLLHIFPYELADRYHCIPVGAERGVLTLATCQRLQQEIVIHLCEVTQYDIFQVRCEGSLIDDVLRHWQHATAV